MLMMKRSASSDIKKMMDMLIMVLAFLLFFGIAIVPQMREHIEEAFDVVFVPLVHISGNFLIAVLIISVLTGVYTSLIQKFTMNFELIQRSKEIQKRFREVQRAYIEARRSDDKKRLKKIEREQKRLMGEQMQISGELLRQNMKSMAYSIFVTIPVFFWMWGYTHNEDIIARFPMMNDPIHLSDSIFIFQYWMIWYFICSIVATMIIRKVLGM